MDVPAQRVMHRRDGGDASSRGEVRRAQRGQRPALDVRRRGPRAGDEGLERGARAAECGSEHRGSELERRACVHPRARRSATSTSSEGHNRIFCSLRVFRVFRQYLRCLQQHLRVRVHRERTCDISRITICRPTSHRRTPRARACTPTHPPPRAVHSNHSCRNVSFQPPPRPATGR